MVVEEPAGTVDTTAAVCVDVTVVADMVVEVKLEDAGTAPAEVELGDADEATEEMVVVSTTELVTVDDKEEATEGKLIEDDLSTVMVLLAVE